MRSNKKVECPGKFVYMEKCLVTLGFNELTPDLVEADKQQYGIKPPKARRIELLKNQVIFRKYFKNGYYLDVITSYVREKASFAPTGRVGIVAGDIRGKKVYDMYFNRVVDFEKKTIAHATLLNIMFFFLWPKSKDGKRMIIKRVKRKSGKREYLWQSIFNKKESVPFFSITKLVRKDLKEHLGQLLRQREYYRTVTREKLQPQRTGSQIRKKYKRTKRIPPLRTVV